MKCSVVLNQKEYEIKYDFNAICTIEEKMGKGIHALMSEDAGFFSLTRVLIWAGIRHSNPNLTIEIVGNWIFEETKKGKTTNDFTEIAVQSLINSGVLGKVDGDVGENLPIETK
jgi:hypothetical protein